MTKEEAIDNVRSFIGQLTAECQESIHTLIPELAESEGERVRKALIDGIRQIRCKNSVTQEQMLAWLEKQKEQKPAEWKPQPESLEALMYAIEGKWEAIKPTSYLSRRLEDLYDGLVNTFNVDESFIAHENDYVSKSAEWNEEDERTLESFLGWLQGSMGEKTYSSWLKSLPERFSLKPKQGWSEEDEKNLERVTDCIYDFYPDPVVKYKLKDWLKSLRPQPQEETYQAAKHDIAIRFMNYLDENRPEGKMSLSNGECEDIDKAFKENDWAKIIRYVEKYCPSWKPSEEQMEALENSTALTEEQGEALYSLVQDLKKL